MPPVPWGKVALVALAATAVLGGAAAVIIPAVDESKDEARAKEQREREARRQAEIMRLREEQRPRRARLQASASRVSAVRALEAAITRDAGSRLEGPITSTACERSGVRQIYKCLVITSESKTPKGLPLQTGYPFVARVDLRRRKLAWCKQNPTAGEKAGTAFARVRLSRECAGKLAEVL